nr:NAD-dependent epimerase/dehydratase family protein [Angustibacter aerolatus]
MTGATGNIGSALLRRLVDGGHAVTGVVRRVPPEPTGAFARAQWVRADLTDPGTQRVLTEAMAGVDAVVHLAWGFQPSHDEAYLERLGVGGTRQVLGAAADAGVRHVVHMSSVGAYAPKQDDAPVDESWPTTGVPTSRYSRHKAAAERLLDAVEAEGTIEVVTRLRPGIVGQASAGSALDRYGLPGAVPAALLRLLPVLPLDRSLTVPMVHSDDVADAVLRVLEQGAGGAFNLAAPTPVTRDHVAAALGATPVHVPAKVLRVAADLAWRAYLQPVDTGWLDLGFAVPLLDTTRARTEPGLDDDARRPRGARGGRGRHGERQQRRHPGAAPAQRRRAAGARRPVRAGQPPAVPLSRRSRPTTHQRGEATVATDEQTPLDPEALADGRVHRAGEWAVGTSRGEPFAVSRRCRHQAGRPVGGLGRRRRLPGLPVARQPVRRPQRRDGVRPARVPRLPRSDARLQAR